MYHLIANVTGANVTEAITHPEGNYHSGIQVLLCNDYLMQVWD